MPAVDVVEHAAVPATAERVWAMLADVRSVVGCVPGARLGELRDDGRYDASITVRFGMISIPFSGLARIELDQAGRTITLAAQGRDRARTTRAAGDVAVRVTAAADGTTALEVRGRFEFAGPTAQLAQTGAKAVTGAMMRTFAECIARRATAGEGGAV